MLNKRSDKKKNINFLSKYNFTFILPIKNIHIFNSNCYGKLELISVLDGNIELKGGIKIKMNKKFMSIFGVMLIMSFGFVVAQEALGEDLNAGETLSLNLGHEDIAPSTVFGAIVTNVNTHFERNVKWNGISVWRDSSITAEQDFDVFIIPSGEVFDYSTFSLGSVFETTEEIEINGVNSTWNTNEFVMGSLEDLAGYDMNVVAEPLTTCEGYNYNGELDLIPDDCNTGNVYGHEILIIDHSNTQFFIVDGGATVYRQDTEVYSNGATYFTFSATGNSLSSGEMDTRYNGHMTTSQNGESIMISDMLGLVDVWAIVL